MEFTGKIETISKDIVSGKMRITFMANEEMNIINGYEELKLVDKLAIIAKKFRNKRSLDANGYMWVLLQKMAEVLKTDKWTLYLKMLKQYGQFTYIVVKPGVVDHMKSQWRECEVVGDIEVNGVKAVQMLCYFGSSTYNTKEMSVLIDNIVQEAQELGISTISPTELKEMKERWGI